MVKSQDTYSLVCYICGCSESLRMMAHRDNAGQMVGWLFCCPSHVDGVAGIQLVPKAALEQARAEGEAIGRAKATNSRVTGLRESFERGKRKGAAEERGRCCRVLRENCPACDNGIAEVDAGGNPVECQLCGELIRAIEETESGQD